MKIPGLTSLVELVQRRAELDPQGPSFVYLKDGASDGVTLTRQALHEQALRLAGALARHVSPGDRVLLNHQPGLDYITSFFGCLYAGAVAVPVYPPRFNTKMDRLDGIVEDVEPKLALTSRSVREALGPAIASHPGLFKLTWIETDNLPENTAPLTAPYAATPDTLAFLQYTSGSTSSPKGVMLSHGNLLHNLNAIASAFQTDRGKASVSWLPPYHDMGLIGGILEPLYSGFKGVLMSPYSFLMRPIRWLQAISQHKATFSGGPNFAFELCTRRISDRQLEGIDLSSWELAFCGAEPVRAETLEAFARRFAPYGFRRQALYPCFGLAESTLMATGGKRGSGPHRFTIDADNLEKHGRASEADPSSRLARTLVGSGAAAEGTRIEIVDPNARTVKPEASVGEVWISGGSVAQGYWKKPAETEAAFGAHIAGDEGDTRWLRTGDLGFKRGEEVFVTGRIKDLVILRGRNFYPQDIERTVEQSHPSLNVGACAVVSVDLQGREQLVVIQELSRTARGAQEANLSEIAEAIRTDVFENHGVNPYAISLIKPNSLPLTSSGKIQRQLSRQLFLGRTLDELGRFISDSEAP